RGRREFIDGRLHRGAVGPDLRDHRAPARAARAVVRELHDPEPNTRHAVEQIVDDALGDAHLGVGAAYAHAARVLVVDIVADVEVHRGAADRSRPVPGRGQGSLSARAVHGRDAVGVTQVRVPGGAPVDLCGGACGVKTAP